MKQRYIFSRIFSVLPTLLAAFLWLANTSSFAQDEILTSGTSWTVPCGVTEIQVVLVGGGGGGGGSTQNNGGGGGASGCMTTTTFNVTPGDVITYSIGAGGTGGAAGSDGQAGDPTTFTGATTANGGDFGEAGGGGSGGPGGSACNPGGNAGSVGGDPDGGVGGNSPYDGTGGGVAGTVDPNPHGGPGTSYGAGGGGGSDKDQTDGIGGDGADGAVIITYTSSGVFPTVTANVSSTNVCAGDVVTLLGTSTNPGDAGTWSAASGSFSNATDINGSTWTAPATGPVTLTLTNDASGGINACEVTDQVVINITPQTTAGTVSGTSPLCPTDVTTYTVTGTVLNGGAGTWSSSDPSVATVDALGNVTAIGNGSCDIIYTVSGATSCDPTAVSFQTLNVGAGVGSVTGVASLCLVDPPSLFTANDVELNGGTGVWSTSNPAIATVDASGNVTPVSVGTVDIIYTVTGHACGPDVSAQTTINILGCPVYCGSTWTTADEYITNVTFNGTSHPSGADVNGYNDQTGTCLNVVQGESYSITVDWFVAVAAGGSENVAVFFDWNGDGDFDDPNENSGLIGTAAPTAGSHSTGPVDITIPCDAITLGNVRMRVILEYGNTPADGCDSGLYGETEDFCLTVSPETPPTASASHTYLPCATSATLDASLSTGLSGYWTLISGSGDITDIYDPTTTITNLLNGSTTLEWTATSNCNSDAAQTTFVVAGLPDLPVSAGPDQFGCFASTSLEGSSALPFALTAGSWSVSGPGGWSLSNVNDPNATISGLVNGTYTLTWTVVTATCGILSDDVILNIGSVPPAEAGPAQTLCPESATMGADLPAGFTGTWTQTAGPAVTISDVNDPNALMYNMTTGGGQTYTFQWEISGGGCTGTTTDLVTITMNTCTNPAPLSTTGAVTYTGCNYQFTDDGGAGGNYSDNVQQTNMVTFCPDDPNDFAELELTLLNLAPGDFFHVYDSPSPAAPIIAYASSAGLFVDPTPNNPSPVGLPHTITSSTGCLYITFFSNSSTTDPGWEANISCSSTAGTQNQLFVSGLQCGGGGGITVCDSDNGEPYPTENTNAGSPQDIGNGFGAGTHGCIADGEGNSQWVYIAVDDAPGSEGTIAFEFSPAGGQDFDYMLWGPYQGGYACPGYTGDEPIRCSWALNAESFCPWGSEATVGLSPTSPVSTEEPNIDPTDVSEVGTCAEPSQGYDDPQDGWLYPIDAQPGEVYVMLVQNFAQNAANWTFTWTGTATLNCAPAIGLGIELLSFEGERVGRENKLYWHTASEEDNAYFTIERSRDGINWEVLTIVTGAGTTIEQNVYEATDSYPFPGITYYRLEQTDFDGSTTMSRVVPISSELKDDLFGSIFPNPGSGSFYFLYGGKDFNNPVNVSVIDNAGKVISTNTHVGFNKTQGIQIDLDGYPAGIYQVIIEQNGEREVQKLTLIK